MVWTCLVSAISKASSSICTALAWSPPFSSACVGEVYQYVMHKTKHVIRGVVALNLTEASSFRRETRPWCFTPYATLDCSTACVHYMHVKLDIP